MAQSPIDSIEKHQLLRLALELAVQVIPAGEPELAELWELHSEISEYLKKNT